MNWINDLKRDDEVIIRNHSYNDKEFVSTIDEITPDGKIISAGIVFTDGIAQVTNVKYSLVKPTTERISILKAEYIIRHCNPTYEQSKRIIEIMQ